jgi:hypothetical protein
MDSRSDLPLCREALNCSNLHTSGRFSSPSGRPSLFDQTSGFLSKHRYGKITTTFRTTWIPIRTCSSIRQVSQFKSRRLDDSQRVLEVRASDMKIGCIRLTVRTPILLVRTLGSSIWKLLAVDVRPSGQQCIIVRTWLSNKKDF